MIVDILLGIIIVQCVTLVLLLQTIGIQRKTIAEMKKWPRVRRVIDDPTKDW